MSTGREGKERGERREMIKEKGEDEDEVKGEKEEEAGRVKQG